jgi:hypothetical protein
MKKIAIIGSGSAASLTAISLYRFFKDECEVEIYHDSKIAIEPVGQATLLTTPKLFFDAFDWSWYDNPIKAKFKTGASYENWGKKNHNFFHGFPMSAVGMHFIPSLLSEFLLNCGIFKVTEKYIVNPEEDIDADWIYDCRGRSELDYTEYEDVINPLNSVVLGKLNDVDPNLSYTKCIATPDGWTFVIPNYDSTSYGYLYNNTITDIEVAKHNLKELFGVDAIKTLSFKNYRAKSIWSGKKTILNGNKYAFVEPLEASSMAMYQYIMEMTSHRIFLNQNPYVVDQKISEHLTGVQNFLLWHYQYGSKYDTPFWEYAKSLPFEMDYNFKWNVDYAMSHDVKYLNENPMFYSQWNSYNIRNWLDHVAT